MLLVPVQVRPSAIHGLGVFATRPIRAGTVVWQFDPGIDQRRSVKWVEGQPEHVRRFVASHGVLSLDKRSYYLVGDYTLFVNHSDAPNLAPRDDMLVNEEGVVVAARDIRADEELTVDYASIDGGDQERAQQGIPLFAGAPAWT